MKRACRIPSFYQFIETHRRARLCPGLTRSSILEDCLEGLEESKVSIHKIEVNHRGMAKDVLMYKAC
jgi:hypothetical protein